MAAVERALKDYCNDLEDSDLSAASIGIYGDHAGNFVSYLRGEFQPGARLAPYGLRRERKKNTGVPTTAPTPPARQSS
jgi:hypothetical protein